VKAQIVFAQVPPATREKYLTVWTEWTGTLFSMEIRAELFESNDRPGSFTELTWFEPGQEAALGDDRLARLNDELNASAEARTGALEFYSRVA